MGRFTKFAGEGESGRADRGSGIGLMTSLSRVYEEERESFRSNHGTSPDALGTCTQRPK